MDSDSYRTLRGPAAAEPPKTRGSRFLAEAFPAADERGIEEAVQAIRRREHGATHWCWAARVGGPDGGGRPRYSDDGEPAGTAGQPILREIDKRGLADTLVVVTRYYGGVKLGAGGLARAYGEAAAMALDLAAVAERVLREPVLLRFGFDDTAAALRVAQRFGAEFGRPEYDEAGGTLLVRPPRSRADELAAAFIDATAGRGTAERRGRDE